MRLLLTLIIIGICTRNGLAQERLIYQDEKKSTSYFVELCNDHAFVFRIGQYYDKMGMGSTIRSIDTLLRGQPDGVYQNRTLEVRSLGHELGVRQRDTDKLFTLKRVDDNKPVFEKLNNAFFLAEYIEMSEVLNKDYPLNHHSFRNAFDSWAMLNTKDMDYVLFREYASRLINEINDSIRAKQDDYVKIKDDLLKGLATIESKTFKENLMKLPVEFKSQSWYFGTVMGEAAKIRPVLFFEVAEANPQSKAVLFSAVDDDETILQGLKNVEGHDVVRKEFFKDKRLGKTMLIRVFTVYAIFAGLLAWLVIAQP